MHALRPERYRHLPPGGAENLKKYPNGVLSSPLPSCGRVFCATIKRVMTAKAKQNLIAQKAQLTAWIGELDRAIHDLAVKGVSTATISTAGGSKSYTRLNLAELQSLRAEYCRRLTAINRSISGGNTLGIRRVMVTRS